MSITASKVAANPVSILVFSHAHRMPTLGTQINLYVNQESTMCHPKGCQWTLFGLFGARVKILADWSLSQDVGRYNFGTCPLTFTFYSRMNAQNNVAYVI